MLSRLHIRAKPCFFVIMIAIGTWIIYRNSGRSDVRSPQPCSRSEMQSSRGFLMLRKLVPAVIGIFMVCAIMMPPESAALTKKSKKTRVHRRPHAVHVHKKPQKLILRSNSALVQDQLTGEYIIQKNVEAVLPIASITKLMTAMVVLDSKLDLQEMLTIGREDVDTLRYSRSRLPVGTQITRGDALLMALMVSENRAAHALSRAYPGGTPAFVAAMNSKACALGLTDTRFVDPTGLSGANVSSARDLAKMVAAACDYPLIRKHSTCDEACIESGRYRRVIHNTNSLVKSRRWRIGLSKTGYLGEAGRCLVMQARVAGRSVLIILLDAQGKYTRVGDANRIKQWMESKPHQTIVLSRVSFLEQNRSASARG